MKDTDGKPVNAADFIPTIERLGFNRQIDRYVLEMAVRELKESPGIHLALNISAFTASDDVWLSRLETLLRDEPALARRLIIEITETTALHDQAETAHFAATVRKLGCRVALDDFGTGHSSFDHLTALPVDIVKIAGSFVKDLARHPHHQEFIRGLLAVTHNLGLSTVAECVETAEEADLLHKMGVHFQQGYYFGKPSLERPWHISPEPVIRAAPTAMPSPALSPLNYHRPAATGRVKFIRPSFSGNSELPAREADAADGWLI
jgi:EAL domain-containing protein (putative c-di-GMP-specific phosphodiesterase class I)